MPASANKIQPSSDNSEQDEWRSKPPTSALLERRAREHFEAMLAWAQRDPGNRTFHDVEQALLPLIFALGRYLLALFLCRRHEDLAVPSEWRVGGRRFRRKRAQGRELGTFFGKVRYWRPYMHAKGGGAYPLDRALKIPAEGFSLGLTSLMTRLATKVSYAQTTLLLRCFLGWSPSTTSLERAVLGLGKRTAAWFEAAPLPVGDGDVLVIMIDSKATPTATDQELKKRRGKRRKARAPSPRHRARLKRKRRGPKKRKKKGCHSKNGRAATLIVMYTLKTTRGSKGELIRKGPINRWVYASYAKKKHAFAVARREADRRGFQQRSGKLVQIVIDGELWLERYAKEYFAEARLTLDVIHALEYLWKAGRSFFREGSKALEEWVGEQKARLYEGKIKRVVRELKKALEQIPKTGPGNKGKRERLAKALRYLSKRVEMMNYKELLKQDLEISSGPVEGAIRYVIAQRFDASGMRWIRERSEALLQLRCIEINGHWDMFLRFVEAQATGPPGEEWRPLRLQAPTPGPLPTLGLEAETLAA